MKLIIAIASTGSISRAAKKLYKSQPNVSKELKDIEEKYKTTLFERTHSGVRITEAGEVFLNSAVKITSELSTLKHLSEHVYNTPREIHIGSIQLIYCLKAIQEWVGSFMSNKVYSIYIHEKNVYDIIERVAAGKYTLGYITIPETLENYIFKILRNNNLEYKHILGYKKQLLLREDHPLKDKKIDCVSDLRDYPEILIESNHAIESSHDPLSADNKKVIVDGIGSVFGYMNYLKGAYIWSAPIPHKMLDTYDIHVKDCDYEKEKANDYIIYKEASADLEVTKSFIESIQSFVQDLRADYDL